MNEIKAIECGVPDCKRPRIARGLCRLHWERQHKTGTTADPIARTGSLNPMWRGDDAGYAAIHQRLCLRVRPPSCETCGSMAGRMEWALVATPPPEVYRISQEGFVYSVDLIHYRSLCKTCHNRLDLGRTHCWRGHLRGGDNVYVQPSNGKRFCKACQIERRKERTRRDIAARSARFEHGKRP